MRKKIFSFLVLAFALVTFSGCKGQSAAEIDILENSKETNQIVWGVKNDTRRSFMSIKCWFSKAAPLLLNLMNSIHTGV